MKCPAALTELPWIAAQATGEGRWRLDLAGTRGWCWQLPRGLCIAVLLTPKTATDDWYRTICLMLAASRHALDDGILLEDNELWLIRRYDIEVGAVALEASLNRQLAIANFLSQHENAGQHAATTPGNAPRLAGGWA